MIQIIDNGDVTVEVGEYLKAPASVGSQTPGEIEQTFRIYESFKVSREALSQCSKVFKAMLFKKMPQEYTYDFSVLGIGRMLREVPQDRIRLTDTHIQSIEIWFRAIHESDLSETLDVDVSVMWYLADDGHCYDLDVNLLKQWFIRWYAHHDKLNKADLDFDGILTARQWLYPCWIFDYAQGFAEVTKKLVYDTTKHISQHNPTNKKDHEVPVRVISALNAARGSWRKSISKDVFKAIRKLLHARCDEKERLTFGYLSALTGTGVWPLDLYYSEHTISHTLRKLRSFKYPPIDHNCDCCPKDFEQIVQEAVADNEDHFHGLCLDCINRADKSNRDPKGKAEREARRGYWDAGCRITHEEPTWWFSFIARKDEKDHFVKPNLPKKRKREDTEEETEAQKRV